MRSEYQANEALLASVKGGHAMMMGLAWAKPAPKREKRPSGFLARLLRIFWG